MKKLILPLLSILIYSCGNNKSSEVQNLENELKKLQSENITKVEELSNDIITYTVDCKSDDCNYWTESKTDKMTGKTSVRARNLIYLGAVDKGNGKIQIKNNIITVDMRDDKGDVVVTFNAPDVGSCVDDKDKVNILFTDDTRMELLNEAQTNCNGNIALWINKKSKKAKEFASKDIKAIRVTISSKYLDVDLTGDNAIHFKKQFNCLTSNKSNL